MIPGTLLKVTLDRKVRRSSTALVLLLHLHVELDYYEFRRVKLAATSRALGIAKTHLSLAFRLLRVRGYLVEGPREGTGRTYRLSVPRNVTTSVTGTPPPV